MRRWLSSVVGRDDSHAHGAAGDGRDGRGHCREDFVRRPSIAATAGTVFATSGGIRPVAVCRYHDLFAAAAGGLQKGFARRGDVTYRFEIDCAGSDRPLVSRCTVAPFGR